MVTTINKITRYRDQLECTIGNLKFHFSPIFYFHPLGNFRKPKVFYLFQGVQKWSIGLKGVNVNGIASTQDLIRLSNKAFRLRVGLFFFSKSTVKTAEFFEFDQKFAVVKSFWCLYCQFWTSVCLLNSIVFLSKQELVDAEFINSRKFILSKTQLPKKL